VPVHNASDTFCYLNLTFLLPFCNGNVAVTVAKLSRKGILFWDTPSSHILCGTERVRFFRRTTTYFWNFL